MNFSIPDEKEIRKAFAEGEETVVELFDNVIGHVEKLAAQLEKQSGVSEELQARLSKNSLNRTNSLRKSGRNRNGGQPGHTGHTLERSEKTGSYGNA